MKIALFAVGTRGDIQPFVAIGARLAAAGHQVHIAAAKGFGPMITEAGLTHHALPADFQALLQEPQMQAALTSLRGKIKAYSWAAGIMNEQLSAIWEIGLAIAPDLILYHVKAAVAPVMARKLGIPAWPVFLQPGFAPTSAYPNFLIANRSLGSIGNRLTHRIIGRVTNWGTAAMGRRWSRASGIDAGPWIPTMAGYDSKQAPLRLHAYSPHIQPLSADMSAQERQTGYAFVPPANHTPDPALAAFLAAAPSPIYIGFGSMPGVNLERVHAALSGALATTGLRAVVATGWGGIAGLEPGPNLHIVEAVPHSWLFPKVAAVVHHGGSGTTHEGLRWGRPSVVCPVFADQPYFGARVHALGAGPKPIAQKRLTADNLAEALQSATAGPAAQRAGQIGEQMIAEDGAEAILRLVEQRLS